MNNKYKKCLEVEKKTQRIKSNIKQIVRKILCLQLEMRMAKLVVHKILIPPIISLLSGSPAQITVSPDRLNLLVPPAILGSTLVLMQRWSCLVSTVCHLWALPKFKVQDVRLTRDFPDSWLRCSSGLFTSGLTVLMLLGWIILILLNGALFLLISFSCLSRISFSLSLRVWWGAVSSKLFSLLLPCNLSHHVNWYCPFVGFSYSTISH